MSALTVTIMGLEGKSVAMVTIVVTKVMKAAASAAAALLPRASPLTFLLDPVLPATVEAAASMAVLLGGGPAGTGLGGGGLLAHGHTFSGQSLEQICGIDTGVHKGHVGHGEVGGAGGVYQNLAVKQSAGQVGQLQGAFRGSRAG